MSVEDDVCDYCGADLDLMGCDTARMVGGKLWDGQCQEGMTSRWGRYTEQQIQDVAEYLQDRYDADPIDWSAKTDLTPEAFRRRGRQLDYMDTASQMKRYLEIRRTQHNNLL